MVQEVYFNKSWVLGAKRHDTQCAVGGIYHLKTSLFYIAWTNCWKLQVKRLATEKVFQKNWKGQLVGH